MRLQFVASVVPRVAGTEDAWLRRRLASRVNRIARVIGVGKASAVRS